MKVTISIDDLILNTRIDLDEKGYDPKFSYFCIIRTLEDKIKELKDEFKENYGISFHDYINSPIDEDK